MKDVDRISKPKLNNPVLVAGWPGMGLVAFRAVSYMLEMLDHELLAEFNSPRVYPLKSVDVAEGVIEATRLPESRAYYHRANGCGRDVVLFLGEEQPVAGNEWALSDEILGMARELGVNDVYTFAAMVTHIDHRTRPKVWGCVTNRENASQLERHDVHLMKEGQISGLNGLLLGVARHKGMNGTCLLGELPYYLTQISYPMASLAVLESFCRLEGVEMDLEELRHLSAATMTEIDTYFEQIKKDEGEPGLDETLEAISSFDDEEEDEEDEDEDMLN
jgi:hypothetical protein